MADDFRLKSTVFRQEREPSWRELEMLIQRWESRGLRGLTAAQALRLPLLYRAVLSSLSVARSISLDRNLLDYLESLSARAYFCVHSVHTAPLTAVRIFFAWQFPEAMRQSAWAIGLAALILAAGIATGLILTLLNDDWFFAFASGSMAGDRTPDSTAAGLRASLYDFDAELVDMLKLFAADLFSHNARIGVLCFALGFAFGVPVVLLLFSNGATIGAFIALYARHDLTYELLGWMLIHGVTEILALLICAAAGLMLGRAMAFPGRQRRLDALAEAGRTAGRLAVGAILLFFVAALLEAFPRQLITHDHVRWLIAVSSLFLWGLYATATWYDRDADSDETARDDIR